MEYTISKAAETVGLSSYTLRYYEKIGLLPEVKRNENGIRIYKDSDIFWMDLIKCLKDTGMTISEIQYIVELSLKGDGTIPQRKDILRNHKVNLQKQIDDLKISMSKIDKKLEWYDNKNLKC